MSRIIHESTKDLKFKTSIVSNLNFPNSTILSCFLFFSLIIDLHFLISAVIARIFNLTAERVMGTGSQTNEANAEIETWLVNVEAKTRNCPT